MLRLFSDDFVADIGAARTDSAIELLYARQKIVAHAKAFGMQAIDLVHINFKDLQGLREQSLEGSNMGFTGKQVTINSIFFSCEYLEERPDNEVYKFYTDASLSFPQACF